MDPKILREAALAYQAVYDEDLRQELEEQQDFENWVNSLVEEGYDLSEYTWEEMYETYITEIGVNFGGQAAVDKVRAKASAERASAAKLDAARAQRFGSGGAPSAGKDSSGNLRKPAPSAAKPQLKGLSIGQGGFRVNNKPVNPGMSPIFQRPGARPAASAPAARPASTAAARPAASAPTAKPAPTSTAAAKPAPSAGQTGDKTKDMQTWAKANPSLAAKVKPGQSGYGAVQQAKAATGGSAAAKPAANLNTSSITKTAFSSSTPALSKPLSTPSTSSTSSTATPTAAAKPTPTPVKKPMGSSKPGSIVSGFDMFDVVKGYLIDEGYAETEQAAIAIMANMSEGWKLEIIDEAVKGESSDRRRALAAERRKGIKPLSTKEGEKYASHKISQMAYTKRAKMGDDD